MAAATKESFAKLLERLIRNFEADKETYLSPGYPEAQARLDFINPFFKGLGWDVENEAGALYHLRDVWVESGETEGRPDYTFRTGGQTKFFVEAKAPHVLLDSEKHILQTKRYAWNSRDVFFAGLTDFQEFIFYDASLTPDARHLDKGLAFKVPYTRYLEKLDLLWELSRERVAENSLDQFLKKDRASVRDRKPVDAKFVDDLTEWRQELATSIHRLNAELNGPELNEIVQRLLDRIVFLRIAEDRDVIRRRQLWDIADQWEESGGRREIMPLLVDLFSEINRDFNGEIFKPHACEKVKVDSSVIHRLIRGIYPPKSPYRFDVIGVELLGTIYERYLGNTLHVTAKRVSIEPKPEVRKAGGVYYTPKYIVDYIVANTVGKLLEGKKPKDVKNLRILDPACGSGSFLIGAYQYLMDWHLHYYREHPKEARVNPMLPAVDKNADGSLRLSFMEKTRIMQHNLYGVDLDPQAVEVTMMSLYLKALEGERGMLGPKHEKLPELKFNIRCGNSLIGRDFEKGHNLSVDERRRIHPFGWESTEDGFGDIIRKGGFDAVIGNPPYGADYDPAEKDYFQSNYVYRKGKPETYLFFLERGTSLLRLGGMLGFITPNAWLTNHYGVQVRKYLLASTLFENLVDLEPTRVFEDAVVDTSITILRKVKPPLEKETEVLQGTSDNRIVPAFSIAQSNWASHRDFIINLQANPSEMALLTRLQESNKTLESIVEYSQGMIPYKTQEDGKANRYISEQKRGRDWLPLIESARQVRRYEVDRPTAFVKYGDWLWCPREKKFFSEPKILFHRLRKKLDIQLVGAFENTGAINRHSLSNMILRPGLPRDTLLAVLALFNSKLANWWFVKSYGVLMEVGGFKVCRIPLPSRWPGGQEHLTLLAERMIDAHRQLAREPSGSHPASREEIGRMDHEINDIVFDLYGLKITDRKIITKVR